MGGAPRREVGGGGTCEIGVANVWDNNGYNDHEKSHNVDKQGSSQEVGNGSDHAHTCHNGNTSGGGWKGDGKEGKPEEKDKDTEGE